MMSIARATHTIISNRLLEAPCFQTTSPSKCILAGEHAVLRGYPALVVPLISRCMTVRYWQTSEPMTYTLQGPNVVHERLPLADFIQHACHQLPVKASDVTGHFHIQFDAGIAGGLGTSAGIAVAYARWCAWRQLISENELFDYAHRFEHFFHGTSSGLDVAAVLYQQPLIYQIGLAPTLFKASWSPYIYLSFTGKTSDTKQAIAQAIASNDKQADNGQVLDVQMAYSVELMQRGLTSSPDCGLQLLQQAFDLGYQSHQAWGLNDDPQVQHHYYKLKQFGSKAIKPTGAGDGGYVLSLWDQPPVNFPFEMIAVFG